MVDGYLFFSGRVRLESCHDLVYGTERFTIDEILRRGIPCPRDLHRVTMQSSIDDQHDLYVASSFSHFHSAGMFCSSTSPSSISVSMFGPHTLINSAYNVQHT